MTASPDFALLPPEINSARMYMGAGPGPMLAAASAWYGLAAELRATALGYSSVLSELTSQAWYGPASASMAAAAAPYVVWMSTTAAQAEETAIQAEAAVAAYEAAFAATVPPPVIAGNRAQLMVLIATNFFGQNTAAIAAAEAQYAEMWAQDASAMYGYAGASAAASRLSVFDPPQQTTDPAALPAQTAAVAQAVVTSAGTGQSTVLQLMSAVPGTLQTLASPSLTEPGSLSSSWLWDNFGPNANIWNSIFASGFYMPARFLGAASNFMSMSQQAAGNVSSAAEGVAGAAQGVAAAPLGSVGALGNSAAATMGNGRLVGQLSVPPSWTAATPAQSPVTSPLGGAAPGEQPPVTASAPSVPLAGYLGGQGEGRAVPQYGFRPRFVARPPAAG